MICLILKTFKDGKCIFQSFLSKILQMYLWFFLEISNVFMMSTFITALDKKARDIQITTSAFHCVQLVGLVDGNEFIHTFFQVPEQYWNTLCRICACRQTGTWAYWLSSGARWRCGNRDLRRRCKLKEKEAKIREKPHKSWAWTSLSQTYLWERWECWGGDTGWHKSRERGRGVMKRKRRLGRGHRNSSLVGSSHIIIQAFPSKIMAFVYVCSGTINLSTTRKAR